MRPHWVPRGDHHRFHCKSVMVGSRGVQGFTVIGDEGYRVSL